MTQPSTHHGGPAPGRIDLHLRIRVKPGMRDDFLRFLARAKPVYERPGSIDIRLLQDLHDDHRFIELVLYDTRADFEKDQIRVREDPEIIRLLADWRALLAEPPIVETYVLTPVA